jgi:hypothetical protein
MKSTVKKVFLALLMSSTLVSFQNCSGSGSNMPSATELASNSAGGFGGSGATGGGGSGQWSCIAVGSVISASDSQDVQTVTSTAIENSQDAAGAKAIDDCSGLISIKSSIGTYYGYEGCHVTTCSNPPLL